MVTDAEIIRDKTIIEVAKSLKQISNILNEMNETLNKISQEVTAANDIRQYGERRD